MTENQPEGPQAPRSLLSEVFSRPRFMLVVAILILELAIFVGGLLTPVPAATQQSLLNETNSQFVPLQNAGPVQLVFLIFEHNLVIALAEMIPIVGGLVFADTVYTTGLAAQALLASQGLPGQWGAILFAYPFSIVEFSAYAVAVGAGIMLVVAWTRKQLRRELKVFAAEAGVIVGILLAAAAMETATGLSPLVGLVLWLPTCAGVAALLILVWNHKP